MAPHGEKPHFEGTKNFQGSPKKLLGNFHTSPTDFEFLPTPQPKAEFAPISLRSPMKLFLQRTFQIGEIGESFELK
jgi:hypothetical protein